VSLIISVVGTNFCMLGADKRRVSIADDGSISGVLSDNTHKIFRLSNDILYGCAGLLCKGEEYLDPFKEFIHPDKITMRTAAKALERYAAQSNTMQRTSRQYVLCGRDNKGRFCQYILSSATSFQPEWIVPEGAQQSVKLLGPACVQTDPSIAQDCLYQDNIWTTDTELKYRICNTIRAYAQVDWTIGGEPELLVLT